MKCKGYVYIYTIGCQMNTYDSEKLFVILHKMGYEKTDELNDADIVICNTCSIREKAQEKAYSFLGRLADKKKKKTHLVSIMAGCVAQQEKENVFKRIPHLDVVMGTHAVDQLPRIIEAVQSGCTHICETRETHGIFETPPRIETDKALKKVSRFVTIMQGCDNYCTYCVVPYVRGRERSRTPESIVEEITLWPKPG